MNFQNQINMNTSGSDERPPNKACNCGSIVEPYLRPALLNLGIKEKWFPAADTCKKCHDDLREREEREAEIIYNRQKIEKAFKSARISPRFRERTFDNFKITEKNQKAFTAAKNYNLSENGLLFFGPCGTGKTHLAASIANKFIIQTPILFVSCPELLVEIRNSFKNNNSINSLEIAKEVSLLIIDDIGVEKTSDWVRETLFVLINHRYEYRLPTIFTTNCSMSQLSERLGDRIASRIVEMCEIINLDGEDYRLKLKK